MSQHGAQNDILLEFGGGRYRFFLPLKAEVELERLCDNTPLGVIFDELDSSIAEVGEAAEVFYAVGGRARRHYAYHVIRLAAQYGGEAELLGETVKVSSIDATRLVEQHVQGRDCDESVPVAWAILKNTLGGTKLKKKLEELRLQKLAASTEEA